MSIASAIQTKQQQVAAAYTACNNKGATLPSTQNLTNLATCIGTISGGSSPVITSLSVTPTTSAQTITAPSGTDGYSPVNVSAVTAAIDNNIVAGNIKKDVVILGVTGSYEGSGGGGGSGTTDVPLTRFKDDNNNEIGTHYMNFEDGSGNVFKVILLDAQYRLASSQWASNSGNVTDLPLYSNLKSSNVWEAGETATFNTQKILDWCTTNTYTSSACTHCRSKSFTIGGTTYYGQLPNMIEVILLAKHYNQFNALDTSAGSQRSLNFSSARTIWSSSQAGSTGWYLYNAGSVSSTNKTNFYFACPVLEIPNT